MNVRLFLEKGARDIIAEDINERGIEWLSIGKGSVRVQSCVKRKIAVSRKSDQSIFDLASNLVEGTQCTVTVALSAQLALLLVGKRRVHAKAGKSDAKFWDHVNDRLAEATAKAADKEDPQAALQRYFQKTLKADRELYKNGSLHAPTQVVNTWQDTVDDILADGVAAPSNTASTNTSPAPAALGSDASTTPADGVSA
ncbi:hypothetical protein FA13DRAFT_1723504 [Coprinellus micaceus]|uniref:Uncharacterized protein n=1 Tax=Coprinellus micaceus TaxID=71717 RepID=A0A4Y7R4M9_COPMI|nr:hypothetical protein FA13DRAFT_1723504 [Coprinellus micaceus]